MKIIFTVIISIFFITCRNHKETTKSTLETKEEKKVELSETPPQETKAEKYGLVVIFFSIGEGAEYNYIVGLEDSIGAFAVKVGKTIDYRRKAWGREGETDFCIPLVELTKKEREEFIAQTRAQLKSAKWVNIFENHDCPKRGGE